LTKRCNPSNFSASQRTYDVEVKTKDAVPATSLDEPLSEVNLDNVFFVQIGTGVDLHGQDITKAAIRAVEDAIRSNSMPGLRAVLPGGSIDNMSVNVRLAVPCDGDKLDIARIKSVLPYGRVTVEVVEGGMLTSSGVVLPDKQDKNDLIYIVNAAVEVGY